MAKKEKTVAQGGRKPAAEGTSIVINDIMVAQLTRGNQSVQAWVSALRSAESELMPMRKKLYDTYLDVSIDLHLESVMSKRIRAVKTTPFEWIEFDNEVIKENFQSPWFSELLSLIQSRIFYGTTLAEIKLGVDGLICDVEMIPRQNVKPEFGIISKDGYSDEGFRYREGNIPYYILEIGRKNDLGLLSKIAPYVLMKRANLADFMRYNEMFGMPLRVYEYDPMKPGAREEMKKQAEEYGSAAYIVIPKGYGGVAFHDSVKQSTAYAYDKAHEILNNEITIGVLGQILTTGGQGGGSYALGNVHAAVEAAINLEDRLTAEYIINYPFKNNILIPHGYPLDGIKGKFKTADEIGKEKKLELWIKLLQSGAPIAEEDFYKEFGIDPPGARPIVIVQAKTAVDPAQGDDPNPDDPKPDDETKPPTPPAKGKDKPTGGSGAKKQSVNAQLHAHYEKKCERDKSPGRVSATYRSELDGIIEDIINKIRTGVLKIGDVDSDLYNLIGDELFRGVEKGFDVKLTVAEGTDAVMLKALQENVYRFSGFKTYNFVKEANALLVDEAGNVKLFEAFRNDVLALNQQYNVDYLRTEYNHAVATSRMASKWSKFEADKDTLPFLQYDTVGDGRVRVAHQGLDGIIKRVDDPFWNKYMPPLDWNCRCSVRQLAEGEVTETTADKLPQIKKDFQHNWGKERIIFPPDHPQFQVDPADQDNADNNFGMPLP